MASRTISCRLTQFLKLVQLLQQCIHSKIPYYLDRCEQTSQKSHFSKAWYDLVATIYNFGMIKAAQFLLFLGQNHFYPGQKH